MAISAQSVKGSISGNTFDISGSGGDITAISASGVVDVIGNTILSEHAPPQASGYRAVGISVGGDAGNVIANNVIRNLRSAPGGYGVAISAGDHSVVYRNVIADEPATGDTGIDCNLQALPVRNLVVGYVAPYVNCPE
jgi:hypothetical protein